VVQRNPYLQDDLLDNPKRRVQLVEALTIAWGRCKSAAPPRPTRSAMPWWANCSRWRVRLCRPSTPLSWKPRLAAQGTAPLDQTDAKDNIKFDGLSRVSHVTDATDWRVEYPFVVLTP